MTASRIGIILQARLASTRFPGKVLELLGGRTILAQCLRRLTSSNAGRVILATTTSSEDDALAQVAGRMGVSVFRGDRDDVLGRFVEAADAYELDTVIRATADNPAVDRDASARVLAALWETDADYVCESGLPYGAGVEAMTVAALRRVHAIVCTDFEREHLTSGIQSRPDMFRILVSPAPSSLVCPDLRVTVDTREDLTWMRKLYARAGTDPSLGDIIAAATTIKGREAA